MQVAGYKFSKVLSLMSLGFDSFELLRLEHGQGLCQFLEIFAPELKPPVVNGLLGMRMGWWCDDVRGVSLSVQRQK